MQKNQEIWINKENNSFVRIYENNSIYVTYLNIKSDINNTLNILPASDFLEKHHFFCTIENLFKSFNKSPDAQNSWEKINKDLLLSFIVLFGASIEYNSLHL